MKQLEVQILQQAYVLSCPENNETRLLGAVERVDAAMLEIRDAGKIRLRDRIAVLVYGEIIAFDTPERVRSNPRVQEAYLGSPVAGEQASGYASGQANPLAMAQAKGP